MEVGDGADAAVRRVEDAVVAAAVHLSRAKRQPASALDVFGLCI